MRKTPLEIARDREKKDIQSCLECRDIDRVGGWYYCKISGKMLHPLMVECRPDFRCKRRKKVADY